MSRSTAVRRRPERGKRRLSSSDRAMAEPSKKANDAFRERQGRTRPQHAHSQLCRTHSNTDAPACHGTSGVARGYMEMPCFFFCYEPSGIIDKGGEDFPGLEAARTYARAVARELAHGRTPAALERIVVLNESAAVVHVQLLATAALPRVGRHTRSPVTPKVSDSSDSAATRGELS
jgi:uncharacterized protein DUF6894